MGKLWRCLNDQQDKARGHTQRTNCQPCSHLIRAIFSPKGNRRQRQTGSVCHGRHRDGWAVRSGAGGRTRTDTTFYGPRILSPVRLPFRHTGFVAGILSHAAEINKRQDHQSLKARSVRLVFSFGMKIIAFSSLFCASNSCRASCGVICTIMALPAWACWSSG